MSRKRTKNYKRFKETLAKNEQALSAVKNNRQYLDLKQINLDIKLNPNEKFAKGLNLSNTWISQYGRIIIKNKSGKYYLAKLSNDTKKSGKTYKRVWISELNETAYVHRLVAEVWCRGFDAELRNEIHHLDHDGSNNYYKNLIWVNKVHHSFLNRDIKIYFMNNRSNSDFQPVDDLVEVAQKIGINIKVLSFILSKKPDLKSGTLDIYECDMNGTTACYFALERP